MLIEIVTKTFERDLGRLRAEIEQFSESDLWTTVGDVPNSAGNLCLHLNGNLNHFIGATLGNSGYVRERQAEFDSSNISKEQLLASADATARIVIATLAKLTDAEMEKPYPLDAFAEPLTIGHALLHLLTHFNYHLGQINYLRRMLTAR